MDISVIISTHNQAGRLRITLESLVACTLPAGVAWELVLVNNACTDDTDAVAAGHANRLPLKLVHEPRKGLSWGRNAGLAAARGDFLLFTDDDVRVCPAWLDVYERARRGLGAGWFYGGPVESEFEDPAIDPLVLEFAPVSVRGMDYGCAARPLAASEWFVSANWGCDAARLREAGGFDVRLGIGATASGPQVGEETDLMRRLEAAGMKGYYLPEARLHHFVPAAKATRRHVGSRLTESTFFQAARAGAEPIRGRRLFGVPRWLLRQAAVSWVKWQVQALSGRPPRAYFEYCRARGLIRAARRPR